MEIGWHQHVHFLLLIKRMIRFGREGKFIDTFKSILHNLNYYLVFAEVILISKDSCHTDTNYSKWLLCLLLRLC